MLRLSYKRIVKTLGMCLATFTVMSVLFIDELSQEANRSDTTPEAVAVVHVKKGINQGQISDLVKNTDVKLSMSGSTKLHADVPITEQPECTNDTILNLTNLHSQTRLIYNMVPKCASLGIRGVITRLGNRLLQGNYNIGTDYIIPFHHSPEHVRKILELDLNSKRHKKTRKYVYSKHLHFIDFSVIGSETPYYMNVIRDPVEHHISLYYFQRERGRLKMFSPWHLLINSSAEAIQKRLHMSYDECVHSGDMECSTKEFMFTIIPFFCGQDSHCLSPSERSLATAKRNVIRYFPVVGYVENLQAFFQLAEVIWPQFFHGAPSQYNHGKFTKHKTTARKQEPSAWAKSIMRARLGLEYDFYHWIQNRFHCLYERYVESVALS